MTLATELAAKQMNPFQELYEFTIGNNITRYTSGMIEVFWNSKTWYPRPITRSDFQSSTKLDAVKCSVTAPIDSNLEKFIASAPSEPVRLRIIRIFMTVGQEYYVLFEGELIDITFAEHVATANFESRTKIFRNQIPKVIFQSFCNHSLFDSDCSLLEESYKVTAILSSVSGIELYSTTFDIYADGYFTGGHVKFGTDYRMITNHIGTKIVVQVPFPSNLTTGVTVYAYPGCDKKASTCKTKFSNFDNFLGFPYIPTSNITIWGA